MDKTPRIRGRQLVALREQWFIAHPLCALCGVAKSAELDHVIPLSSGGADDDSNRQALCHECHAAKNRRERWKVGSDLNWPADNVERRPVADLIPAARNARTHSDEQVAQLAASMREWGWTMPVLVDEVGTLIAGHGRVLAARKLGLSDIPVMVAAGWSDAKKRAYALADNRLPMNAAWDSELLAVELDDLRDVGVDLKLLGFTPQELNDLIGTPNTGPPPDTSQQLTDGFKFSVIVGAKDEADQGRLLERFEAEGLQCRLLITQ